MYKEYESKFETGQCREGWKLISKTLSESGIKVSPQQCSIKMDTLKRRFKTIKDAHSKTGTSPITWEYYSVMSEIFDKKSWAKPLRGAVSSTLASTSLNEMAQDEAKPGCSKETPKKRKINIGEILNDFKMERQKRDEEKKRRLEENRKKEESEIKKEQRHREKMELKKELLKILKKNTDPSS
ncbi:hypothetical protein JTB14_025729 [Gonioctena quinquepunctata]|nr:hypothetical protein JTB14_025729 [Gonioctena quinquepunctata]